MQQKASDYERSASLNRIPGYAVALILFFGCASSFFTMAQVVPRSSSGQSSTSDRGKQIFSAACAQCHGLDGKGTERAPNIADRATVQRLSDLEISHIIQNGVAGTGMPSFHALDRSQIRALVAHLRILQGRNRRIGLPGNPEWGKTLFFGKGKCSQCHMVAGEGGFLGSDLSEYAQVHEVDQIRNAIVNPANIEKQVRMVIVTLHSGDKYVGRIRNEDNFSVQLQTLDGTFYFLSKSDVDQMQSDSRSLMPSDYGLRLDAEELNDLISYLMKSAGTKRSVTRSIVDGSVQ
ncbi:MAG TPA: c-type cytochrome [Candidatus Aquilonibacter sp.]|nr:c-type cytochrome [Candidatus Aquilonibacter sp.]